MDFSSGYKSNLLDGVKRLHFIGIGGSGMYPLVQILHARGFEITGSDVNEGSIVESERALGISVTMGHKAENVLGADMVVYSAAIHSDNPGNSGGRSPRHSHGGAQRNAGLCGAAVSSQCMRGRHPR